MTVLASSVAVAVASPAPESPPAASPSVSVATLYREMWRYAAGARGRLLLAFGLLVASQLVKLAVPWLAAQAIDCLQHGAGTGVGAAWPWLAAILGVFVGSWAMHGPARVVERSVAVRVRQAITDKLYERLADTPLAWHDRHHPGEIQHRMAQSSGALFDFTQTQFIYLQSAVNLLGPLVALSCLSTLAGGIAMLGIVGIALVLFAFDRSLMRLADVENAAHRRYGAALLDCLSNMSTVLSLGLAGSTGRTLRRRLDAANQPLGRSIVLNEWKWCAVDLLTVTLAWLLVGAYAWQSNAAGALILGSLFMVYQYAQQAGSVVGAMASNLQGFSRMRTDFAGADAIWSAPRRTPDADVAPAAGPRADDDWQRIDVCDLAYEHTARSTSHDPAEKRGGLRHVSLALHRGERIALVGPSGSGKSTLLRVLAGLYEPSHGHVEVDGIAHLGMRPLARRATLIPQEAQVFEGSVRDNIAFDLPYAESTIDAAARISSFDAVLEFLPGGLQAAVAQGGFNLSGGQRQRLCLARGVLAARDRSLLLLDEPTSALDPLTESAVFRRIGDAFPSACIVASVHRMNLLGHFDRVVLMNAGGIVDSGSVAELLERQPMFREMVGEADAALPSGIARARETVAAA